MRIRRVAAAVTAALAAGTAAFVSPPAANAAQGCGFNNEAHCYAVAEHAATSSMSAFNLETHANFMTPGCSSADVPNHITAEQWVIMSDDSYIETGIINAWTY